MASLVLNGNTSGSVTISSPAVSGTTTLTLPTTTGTVLTSASNTNFPAGSVLQVVSATYSTVVSTTSGTPQASGLTASITPSSSSSKILVIATMGDQATTAAGNGVVSYLYRNGSNIGGSFFGSNQTYISATVSFNIGASQTINYLDSPSTTSSTTYAIYFNSKNSGASTVSLFRDNTTGSITLMEIKG